MAALFLIVEHAPYRIAMVPLSAPPPPLSILLDAVLADLLPFFFVPVLPRLAVTADLVEVFGVTTLCGARTLCGAHSLCRSRLPRESPIQGHRSGDESSGKLYKASGAWCNTAQRLGKYGRGMDPWSNIGRPAHRSVSEGMDRDVTVMKYEEYG